MYYFYYEVTRKGTSQEKITVKGEKDGGLSSSQTTSQTDEGPAAEESPVGAGSVQPPPPNHSSPRASGLSASPLMLPSSTMAPSQNFSSGKLRQNLRYSLIFVPQKKKIRNTSNIWGGGLFIAYN